MLGTLFLICTVVGGTVFVCQFLLSIFSVGGHIPGAHHLHMHVGDIHDADTEHSTSNFLQAAHNAIPHGGLAPKSLPSSRMGGFWHHALGMRHVRGGSGESWLGGMISFQGIVAATTAFGLAGMAALSQGWWSWVILLVAFGTGACASAFVAVMMRTLMQMDDDGTVQTQDCVGSPGSVYLSVPANNSGMGKVLIHVQGRTMEYQAITWVEKELAIGDEIIVVGVHAPGVLEISPAANVPTRVEL